MLTALAPHMADPWAVVVLVVVILFNKPLRMISMRFVHLVYSTSKKDRADYVRREASRDRLLDAMTTYLNRPQRREAREPVRRLRSSKDEDEGRAA